MFGSDVLEVAAGLVMVFLLMSLVLTALQEAIEGVLKSRARDLEHAISELLQNDRALLGRFYEHPLVSALYRGTWGSREARGPGIRGLGKPGTALPSYIPREIFSATMIDLFRDPQTSQQIQKTYRALDRIAGGDVERLRAEIEGWYDSAMDRATGWFKRRTQVWLFALGLTAALVLNVNTLVLARTLVVDKQARAYAAAAAEKMSLSGVPDVKSADEMQAMLQRTVGLPIGWSDSSLRKLGEGLPRPAVRGGEAALKATIQGGVEVAALILGYLATGLAMTLGAPFWFDVLGRIMVIRSTIKPSDVRARPMPDTAMTAGDGLRPGGGIAPEGSDLDGELDGCVADHQIDPSEVTDDADLPAARGGVATQ